MDAYYGWETEKTEVLPKAVATEGSVTPLLTSRRIIEEVMYVDKIKGEYLKKYPLDATVNGIKFSRVKIKLANKNVKEYTFAGCLELA